MKHIELTKGARAAVDDEDFENISKHKWNLSGRYARRISQGGGKRKMIYMHRQIMGFPADMQIDHISGDGLDNRRVNLRACSPYENSIHQRLHKNNTSGFKGVHLGPGGKWGAKIQANNRQVLWLGYFFDKRSAALTYNIAARKLHGEFAILNELRGYIS